MVMPYSGDERLRPLELVVGEAYSFVQPADVDLQRLGRNMDGGYLVPTAALAASSKLITFGVGPDWSFEQDFLCTSTRNEVFAYDFSVSSYLFFEDACLSLFKNLSGKSNLHQLHIRLKRYIDWLKFRKERRFHFYENRVYDRNQFSDCITVDEVFGSFKSEPDFSIILKCDIEGGEYRIGEQILKYSEKISCIIMELHDIGPLFPVFKELCLKINANFVVSHIHPNNSSGYNETSFPDVVEISFLNKSLVKDVRPPSRECALHRDDRPCDPRLPEISLSFR